MDVCDTTLIGVENTVTVIDILNRWWVNGELQRHQPQALHTFDLHLSDPQAKAIVASCKGLQPRLGACTRQYVQ